MSHQFSNQRNWTLLFYLHKYLVLSRDNSCLYVIQFVCKTASIDSCIPSILKFDIKLDKNQWKSFCISCIVPLAIDISYQKQYATILIHDFTSLSSSLFCWPPVHFQWKSPEQYTSCWCWVIATVPEVFSDRITHLWYPGKKKFNIAFLQSRNTIFTIH